MRLFFYSIICSCLFTNLVYAQSTSLEKAQQAFQQGRFDQAASYWQAALDTLSEQNESRLEALLGLALSYKKLGFYDKTLNRLGEAFAIARDKANQALILSEIADIHMATHKQTKFKQKQSLNKAEQCLQEAEILARNVKKPRLLAKILNKQGNRLTMLAETKRRLYDDAIKKYNESEKYAKKANDLLLVAKVKINLAEATFLRQSRKFKNSAIIVDRINAALQAARNLPDSHDKSFGLISLARIAMQTAYRLKKENALKQQVKLQRVAYHALQYAKQVAEQITDDLALSYAYGRLGELYYNAKRYTEAVSLTRKALFFAPKTQEKGLLSELVYQWYWQLGRLFKAQKKPDEAIKMYQSAIEYLQPIRQRLVKTGYSSKRKQFSDEKAIYSPTSSSFELLYFELIDLLLQRLKSPQISHKKLKNIKEALLYTLERFQVDELKSYFHEELCFLTLKKEKFKEQIDQLLKKFANQQTAILYPILLSKPNKQAQLLVILPSGDFSLFPISASKKEINSIVKNYSNQLVDNSEDYLDNAKQLYNWLIRPIETTLRNNNINTLVVVPNETLRIIPFSAFHDGKDFLIKNYAVVVTQALALTKYDDKPLGDSVSLFLGGVSEPVQNFPGLDNVKFELKNIEKLYSENALIKNLFVKNLLNDEFKKDIFEEEIRKNRYMIIHIASHGKFDSNPSKSFLLTYDKKLNIYRFKKLMQFQVFQNTEFPNETIKLENSICEIPASTEGSYPKNAKTPEKTVEELIWYKDYSLKEKKLFFPDLLTLSACQTAKSDKNAALGLAGITVKVGVKSALANLWEVNDKAASELSVAFYKYLQDQKLTKAQALQAAQKELMQIKDFQHPYYWAPLILLGNWR